MQIGYSVQRGARRASSSLVPRLAPRGFPVRQGWRGGERQGWRVSAVRKGGGCAGCEKGHGRGRVTFPPLGSVLTSHRSDSRSGTKWWGAASLPGPDVLLSPASRRSDSRAGGSGGWKAAGTNEERKRRAGVHFPGRHLLLASCRSGTRFSGGVGSGAHTEARGERTGWQGKKKRRCALASARMTGRGILPHVDRAPGSAGVWGAARTRRREASARGVRARKNRCALASARGGGAREGWCGVLVSVPRLTSRGFPVRHEMTGRGILPPRRSGSRFSAGRRGEERARCGPTRLNAIRPALFVRGDSLWIPAATYLPRPSPAKYCRRMRA